MEHNGIRRARTDLTNGYRVSRWTDNIIERSAGFFEKFCVEFPDVTIDYKAVRPKLKALAEYGKAWLARVLSPLKGHRDKGDSMMLRDVKSIKASNPVQLSAALSAARMSDGYAKSRTEIKHPGVDLDGLEALKASISGRFSLLYEGIRFECFAKPQLGAQKLYVFFSGARPAETAEPQFKRWSYWDILDGNVLCVDDPMIQEFPSLRFGWYYGTSERNYLLDLRDVVCAYAAEVGVSEVVFVSSSAGGFAALYMACVMEGTTAVAINPQIRLSIYSGWRHFAQITGVDVTSPDPYGRNDLPELIAKADKSRFLIIENVLSREDMNQLAEVHKALNYAGATGLGIQRLAPHVLAWVYEAFREGELHSAQEWKEFFPAIDFLATNFVRAEELEDEYLIFTNLWRDWWETWTRHKQVIARSSSPSASPQSESFVGGDGDVAQCQLLPLDATKAEFEIVDCLKVERHAVPAQYAHAIIKTAWKPGVYTVTVKRLSGAQTFAVRPYDRANRIAFGQLQCDDGEIELSVSLSGNLNHFEILLYPNRLGDSANHELSAEVVIKRLV